MATLYTCETPDDAWGLVTHFVSNYLLAIGLQDENPDPDEEKKKRFVEESQLSLIGGLYVVRRMLLTGHAEDANNIQEILDVVMDLDVTKKKVQQAILDMNTELNARQRTFVAELAATRKELGKK